MNDSKTGKLRLVGTDVDEGAIDIPGRYKPFVCGNEIHVLNGIEVVFSSSLDEDGGIGTARKNYDTMRLAHGLGSSKGLGGNEHLDRIYLALVEYDQTRKKNAIDEIGLAVTAKQYGDFMRDIMGGRR
jgi:hypothetical protein